MPTVRCSACGEPATSSARFCPACGRRLALRCPSCGAEVGPVARFCEQCGAGLGAVTPSSAGGQGQGLASNGPRVEPPDHLAQRILASRSALEGERKQVTVVFADLKGSMELLADRDPEEARALLDPVLERMIEAVHRYEGTVNQVMGDGIMALFGAPVAHEDHAVRACYAALRMQEAVRGYAEEARRRSGVRIQIRVGLNSGEVVVRAIGSDLRMDYTAVGQTTHLAARMEQLAEPGTVLLPAATLDLAEGLVTVRSLGPVPIKGLAAPIEVFELTGAGAARSRLQAAAARGLTRFVGRSAELEHVARVLELAGAGHGQVVGVMGEPGVGKSRLVWEVTHSHRTQGWLTLETGSVSHGKVAAYLPVIGLLKSYCRIESGDDARRIREKLAGKLLALDPGLIEWLSPLLALLGVETGDVAWDALDPSLRRHRTLEAIRRLLLREAQVQPLLLVVEDLHWIDAETQAILDAIVDSLPAARLLLLVNYRPEYELAWGRKTYCSQLRLNPLSGEGADELLDALLGAEPAMDDLRSLLVHRTEGNPFFLEESVRTLVESGALAGERGAYRLTRPIDTVQVPATVQAVLAARIDRLPPDQKRLLQAASVIGKDVPVDLLAAVGGGPPEALERGLADLQAAEFLYTTRLFPVPEYTFKHALTQDVAYGSLLHERRRALHADVLAAIEQLHAGRLDEYLEPLALHAARSESWERAVAFAAAAGRRALGRWTLREALASFEQALAALRQLPRTADNLRDTVHLNVEARVCLLLLGDLAPMTAHLEAAAAAAETLGDAALRAIVAGQLAHTRWQMRQHRQAIDLSRRVLDLIRGTSETGLEAAAYFQMGEAHHSLGDFERAAELLSTAVALRDRDARPVPHLVVGPELIARRWWAQSLAELGRFDEAAVLAREAIEMSRERNNPYALANALTVWGFVCARQGRFHDALPALEEGLQTCRTLEFRDFVPTIGNLLAEALVEVGRLEEARALLDEIGFAGGVTVHVSAIVARLGAGRVVEARQNVEGMLDRCRELGERSIEAWTLWLSGEMAAREATEEAAAWFRKALTLAEELGMRPLAARCRLGLGEALVRDGQSGPARDELGAAIRELRALGMVHWLPRAEAALARAD
jgi:class 3 adenylate cyclase/tetratricopeptide (TPR) repeat protein